MNDFCSVFSEIFKEFAKSIISFHLNRVGNRILTVLRKTDTLLRCNHISSKCVQQFGEKVRTVI